MDQIGYDFAPSNPQVYNNTLFGPMQGTGGSTAMANSYLAIPSGRGRCSRYAAARRSSGMGRRSQHPGASGRHDFRCGQVAPMLGEFVEAAAVLDAPTEPRLKDPSEFRLIGNPDVRRLDSAAKGNGTAMFAMDIQRPNQMIAMIARPEQQRATAVSVDASGAEAIKGFISADILPNKAGVAVFAENTWAAMQARDAISVEWDTRNAETRSSDQIEAEIRAALEAEPTYNVNEADAAAVRAAH